MTRRPNGGDPDGQDIVNGQLKQLFDDDTFLTDLSRGVDPSEGSDALAGLLLEMNREANAQMPAAPDLSKLLPGFEDLSEDTNPGTTEFAPISKANNSTEVDSTASAGGAVVALDSRRNKRGSGRADKTKRNSHPFLHGLVGAAAATLVIAGGGTAIYNADADSPLHGLSTQVFGNSDNPSVVELASTLEEVDSRTANGDVEGARELLEQARTMLTGMNERQRSAGETGTPVPAPAPQTITSTVTEMATPEQQPPETITETATQTSTVVSTVTQAPIWTPEPSQTLAPPQTITENPAPPAGEDDEPVNGGGQLVPPQGVGF